MCIGPSFCNLLTTVSASYTLSLQNLLYIALPRLSRLSYILQIYLFITPWLNVPIHVSIRSPSSSIVGLAILFYSLSIAYSSINFTLVVNFAVMIERATYVISTEWQYNTIPAMSLRDIEAPYKAFKQKNFSYTLGQNVSYCIHSWIHPKFLTSFVTTQKIDIFLKKICYTKTIIKKYTFKPENFLTMFLY